MRYEISDYVSGELQANRTTSVITLDGKNPDLNVEQFTAALTHNVSTSHLILSAPTAEILDLIFRGASLGQKKLHQLSIQGLLSTEAFSRLCELLQDRANDLDFVLGIGWFLTNVQARALGRILAERTKIKGIALMSATEIGAIKELLTGNYGVQFLGITGQIDYVVGGVSEIGIQELQGLFAEPAQKGSIFLSRQGYNPIIMLTFSGDFSKILPKKRLLEFVKTIPPVVNQCALEQVEPRLLDAIANSNKLQVPTGNNGSHAHMISVLNHPVPFLDKLSSPILTLNFRGVPNDCSNYFSQTLARAKLEEATVAFYYPQNGLQIDYFLEEAKKYNEKHSHCKIKRVVLGPLTELAMVISLHAFIKKETGIKVELYAYVSEEVENYLCENLKHSDDYTLSNTFSAEGKARLAQVNIPVTTTYQAVSRIVGASSATVQSSIQVQIAATASSEPEQSNEVVETNREELNFWVWFTSIYPVPADSPKENYWDYPQKVWANFANYPGAQETHLSKHQQWNKLSPEFQEWLQQLFSNPLQPNTANHWYDHAKPEGQINSAIHYWFYLSEINQRALQELFQRYAADRQLIDFLDEVKRSDRALPEDLAFFKTTGSNGFVAWYSADDDLQQRLRKHYQVLQNSLELTEENTFFINLRAKDLTAQLQRYQNDSSKNHLVVSVGAIDIEKMTELGSTLKECQHLQSLILKEVEVLQAWTFFLKVWGELPSSCQRVIGASLDESCQNELSAAKAIRPGLCPVIFSSDSCFSSDEIKKKLWIELPVRNQQELAHSNQSKQKQIQFKEESGEISQSDILNAEELDDTELRSIHRDKTVKVNVPSSYEDLQQDLDKANKTGAATILFAGIFNYESLAALTFWIAKNYLTIQFQTLKVADITEGTRRLLMESLQEMPLNNLEIIHGNFTVKQKSFGNKIY